MQSCLQVCIRIYIYILRTCAFFPPFLFFSFRRYSSRLSYCSHLVCIRICTCCVYVYVSFVFFFQFTLAFSAAAVDLSAGKYSHICIHIECMCPFPPFFFRSYPSRLGRCSGVYASMYSYMYMLHICAYAFPVNIRIYTCTQYDTATHTATYLHMPFPPPFNAL